MKEIITIPNVGPWNATYQFEEELTEEAAQFIRKAVLQQIEALCSQPSRKQITVVAASAKDTPQGDKQKDVFVPPSPAARNALQLAAQFANKSIPEACQEHGFNPDHLSKKECQIITSELNKQSGYSKIQEERKKHPGRFLDTQNLPPDNDIFED